MKSSCSIDGRQFEGVLVAFDVATATGSFQPFVLYLQVSPGYLRVNETSQTTCPISILCDVSQLASLLQRQLTSIIPNQ